MVDPAKQLDVEGVLQHPWMTSEDLSDVVLKDSRSDEKIQCKAEVQGWHYGCTNSAKAKELKVVRRRIVLMEAYTLHGFINYYLFLADPIIDIVASYQTHHCTSF